ncbi:hypothetical protein NQ315_012184 [Exocentrus adspersus]|uniref:Protein SON n=1 Tax=Exocentrus adspersus TaxID=1586481 RepID=A0AAV8W009_9CUCU|nr:hypothetical protein NQ315_012184 [Exocentrus adspersus]
MSENEEQKPTLPTKSSMEILSELFSTFHAEPPLIIKKEKSEDSSKKHKKSKKKHKHKDKKHKKKEKKKKKADSSSSDDTKLDLAKILIKQEKDASEKKIKIEGTDIALEIKNIKVKKEKHLKDTKRFPANLEITSDNDNQSDVTRNSKIYTTLNTKSKEGPDKIKKEFEEEGEVSESASSVSDKGFKRSFRKFKHIHSKKRSRSSSDSSSNEDKEEKKLKIDDLRTKINKHKQRDKSQDKHDHKDRARHKDYSKDTDFYKGSSRSHSTDDRRSRDRERDKIKDKRKDHRSRSRDRYHHSYTRDIEDYKRHRSRDNSFYKDDGFYKSRDREDRDRYRSYTDRDRRFKSSSRERETGSKFDKKKLLEIARRNAITMMKSGSLPGALSLGPQAQEKVIAAIKSGGKTIEELTDFCKTLSKKEELGELSSLSEKDDSDSETDKPFHHPFQIKDRPTSITMNIKNSVPLPIKSSMERTSELRMQFPVSSGQQHRKGEEWLPVSPPPMKKIEENKPVPAETSTAAPAGNIPLPIEAPPLPPVIPIILSEESSGPVTVPATPNSLPGPQLFPTSSLQQPAVDIGSIVSQRLTAMRKLQENPNDVQALTQIYKSNKEMQCWAASKQQLGQFTGSTGAQVLSQAQLASGYQAWAKKDQLQTAAPVSGGMGMHLLQKMGWKPGEGLGKEKTGALEPLLLEVKLDKKGLVANEEQKSRLRKQKTQANVKNLQGKHPVSLLGEYASKKKLGAPQYILEFECGPDHKKNFLFKVVLNGCEYKPNVASNNKKEAKAAAATICLQAIGLLPA